MKVCTVFDSKAEAWLQPFFTPTTATAVRAWEKVANEEGHEFHSNPADYTLFEIGQWNDVEGYITMHDAKISLGTALEMKHNQPAMGHPVAIHGGE